MSISVHQKITGLDLLENGLQILKRSRMMVMPEFKDMFGAIERHHRDLRLAHLTGKTKDLMDQAQRDTKFYNILVKMLSEVKEGRSGKQRENLRKVYTWYLSNKHVLYSGPHFGKSYQKQQAQDVLKKALTPREQTPGRSPGREQTPGRSPKREGTPGRSPSREYYSWQDSNQSVTSGHSQDDDITTQNGGLSGHGTPIHDGDFSDTEVDLELTTATMDYDDVPDENMVMDSGRVELQSRGYGSRTPSVRFTPLREQSSNMTHTCLPRKMVHSIASMVNPHAQSSLTIETNGEYSPGHQTTVHLRPTAAPHEILTNWKHFNSDWSYGQDVISKLSFVWRSGTGLDVRYAAHKHGEMPELNTRHVISNYGGSNHAKPINHRKDENALLQQTLEEFYQTTESYYPASLPKYRLTQIKGQQKRVEKPKSAPVRSLTRVSTTPTLGKNLLQNNSSNNNVETRVRLDTVVNMIDSVSDQMLHFKEKIAPDPQPGFRQPSVTGLPTSPSISRPSTTLSRETASGSDSPMARTNTPVGTRKTQVRPQSQPAAEQDIFIQFPDGQEDARCLLSASSGMTKAGQVVDWRGKIMPDTMRYKWSKTRFGGHTYIKKLQRPLVRSAGGISTGSRPKTAPRSYQEKWKTEKASDQNSRIIQAASHNTTSMDQQSLDSMMVINPLVGTGELRDDYMESLFDLDKDFFKSIHRYSYSMPEIPPTLEYLSFVLPSKDVGDDQTSNSHVRKSDSESQTSESAQILKPDISYLTGQLHPSEQASNSEIRLPLATAAVSVSSGAEVDQRDINELEEELQNLCDEESQAGDQASGDKQANSTFVIREHKEKKLEVDEDEKHTHVEVTAVPPAGKVPVSADSDKSPLQRLTKSQPWQFSPDDLQEEQNFRPETPSSRYVTRKELPMRSASAQYHREVPWAKSAAKLDSFYLECISPNMTTKVERSAGRMPGRASSASSQVLRMARRQNEYFKRAPPMRTPPSIPSPHSAYGGRSPRSNQFNSELEHHARKVKSPRHFMEHVRELRHGDSSWSAPPVLSPGSDGQLSSSLQICGLSTRSHSVMITADYTGEQPQSILKSTSEHSFMREDSESEKQVKFGGVYSLEDDQDDRDSESGQLTSPTSTGHCAKQSMELSAHKQSLAHIGRPIAQYQSVPDPSEISKAVQLQKEAAAAVDIQRLFRGYVARSIYKKLLKEERERLEDQRKAAVEIQRIYRGHLIRKQAIGNRGPDAETLRWAKDYKMVLNQKEKERNAKMENKSRENAINYHNAATKLSVIGPHVEIYQIYHPKRTGPTRKELNHVAIEIQRHVRGWLIRRKLEKLKRKASWQGSSFQKMVKDYKSTLSRVQLQHGRERPKTPFTFKDMNEYLDLRRRYESVFDKKSFGGELELSELEDFFRESDLYPSQTEVEEAIDVVFRGQGVKKGHGLKKREALDILFYIYVPKAAGLENTRSSTWLNPIIDGEEARRLLGTEFVESAPLEVCAKLVIDSKRERREKEAEQLWKQKQEEERKKEEKKLEQNKKHKKEDEKAREVTVQFPEKTENICDTKFNSDSVQDNVVLQEDRLVESGTESTSKLSKTNEDKVLDKTKETGNE